MNDLLLNRNLQETPSEWLLIFALWGSPDHVQQILQFHAGTQVGYMHGPSGQTARQHIILTAVMTIFAISATAILAEFILDIATIIVFCSICIHISYTCIRYATSYTVVHCTILHPNRCKALQNRSKLDLPHARGAVGQLDHLLGPTSSQTKIQPSSQRSPKHMSYGQYYG